MCLVGLVQTVSPWIAKAWRDELETLVVASPVNAHGIPRPSWWRESLNADIGWNEKKGIVELGAETAYYGPPIEPPCPTEGLQRDHQVAWENALISGLVFRPSKEREDFYNYSPNVFILDAHTNDEKSDHPPDVWKPADKAKWRQYARDWIDTKSSWGLTVTPAEKRALAEMLETPT